MMNRKVFNLIAAVRNLDLSISTEVPGIINIGGDPETFPSRLYDVAICLAAVDSSDGPSLDMDPVSDPIKLKLALDGVFKWMRVSGIDLQAPLGVVRNVMTNKVAPTPMPKYAKIKRRPIENEQKMGM